ncbi:MAG: ATP-binding protein [Promethearchaeota archaeon]|nr:MAG: ATP-binding protein [Candidatus Lokiarchaeota archaeon]
MVLINLLINTTLVGITLCYYILKIINIRLSIFKYLIPGVFIGSLIEFFLNLCEYIPNGIPRNPIGTIIIAISQLLLLISLIFYVVSILYEHEDNIELKGPTLMEGKKGDIYLGKIIKGFKRSFKFFLSEQDLEKHMFICGATGTGKSNFVQNFLVSFKKNYSTPFLLVEFKREYNFLKHLINDLFILRPGENFSINIFNPNGIHPEIHAERIFDIMKSGQFLDDSAEFSPQMQKVMIDILTDLCKNRKLQTWEGFFQQCKVYAKEHQREIPMLNQTIISIKNRIRRFSIGPLKTIFCSKNNMNIHSIFQKNIIIDLSSIIEKGGEKEDALFFLNMILKYLWDRNLTNGAKKKKIKHLTIIEDAQYFIPKDLVKQSRISTYLEDIALLQRGTGECLISIATRPHVSEEILANCGVLVIFKNHMQKELQCQLLNLNDENEDYISMIEMGRCIIRVNSIKRPFLIEIPLISRYL